MPGSPSRRTLIAGQPQAELMAPGHPLLEALVDVVLERFQPLLGQGGVLVDDADEGDRAAAAGLSRTRDSRWPQRRGRASRARFRSGFNSSS